MIVRKPSILIYSCQADEDLVREICGGIKEEGILFEITEKQEGSLDDLAYEAAEESMLGSGIGVVGKRAAMQMRPVPRGENVYELNHPSFEQCRCLGANSARAVKKLPFKEIY